MSKKINRRLSSICKKYWKSILPTQRPNNTSKRSANRSRRPRRRRASPREPEATTIIRPKRPRLQRRQGPPARQSDTQRQTWVFWYNHALIIFFIIKPPRGYRGEAFIFGNLSV